MIHYPHRLFASRPHWAKHVAVMFRLMNRHDSVMARVELS
jgi:hypothetical protein